MRRYKYGLNCQSVNYSRFFEVLPLHYMEVVPGDTIQGQFQTRLFSDTTVKPLLNRAYVDIYAFYVPYRLLWEPFPDFVSQKVAVSPPVVNDLFPQNFENGYVLTEPEDANLAWQRYAYNLIVNKFFRPTAYPDRANNRNDLAQAPMRQSTFFEALQPDANQKEVAIPTGSITDLREAFSQDRFNKIRSFYGNDYVDYLAAMGVEASWSILDEPEVIGMKHADLRYKIVNATANVDPTTQDPTALAQPAGYYDGVVTCKVNRTFCPEHGLICFMGVPRIDTLNTAQSGLPLLAKNLATQFFSPEYLTERKQEWPDSLLGTGGVETVKDTVTPIYEDLRKASHIIAGGAPASDLYFATFDSPTADYTKYNLRFPEELDNLFTGVLGGGESICQQQMTSVFRLQRLSPIRPDTSSSGVS